MSKPWAGARQAVCEQREGVGLSGLQGGLPLRLLGLIWRPGDLDQSSQRESRVPSARGGGQELSEVQEEREKDQIGRAV